MLSAPKPLWLRPRRLRRLRCLAMVNVVTTSGHQVLDAALRLPTDERTELIRALIESLDGAADPGASKAWAKEIARRVKQIDSGAVALVDWTTARARIEEKLSKRR